MFQCSDCEKTFTIKSNMKRHKKESCVSRSCGATKRKLEEINCDTGRKKPRLDAVVKPSEKLKKVSKITLSKCKECNMWYFKNRLYAHLRSNQHKNTILRNSDNNVSILTSAFKYRIISYMLRSSKQFLSIDDFFKDIQIEFIRVISQQLLKHKIIKLNVELFSSFILQSKETIETKSFNVKNKVVSTTTNLNTVYEEFLSSIKEKVFKFAGNGSGWALQKILHLEININKYNPLRASSYIPLPKEISKKKQ